MVKGFGAPEGMLLIEDYYKIESHIDEIINMGYGFSVIDDAEENEEFIIEEFKEVLSDWGWSGTIANKPNWVVVPQGYDDE